LKEQVRPLVNCGNLPQRRLTVVWALHWGR
jgi:hypothetical protein